MSHDPQEWTVQNRWLCCEEHGMSEVRQSLRSKIHHHSGGEAMENPMVSALMLVTNVGLSENGYIVPLNPMVNDHYPY